MRAASFAALGIAAYGVILAATVPASVLVARFHRAPDIELTDVRGTLWRGSAHARWRVASGAIDIETLEGPLADVIFDVPGFEITDPAPADVLSYRVLWFERAWGDDRTRVIVNTGAACHIAGRALPAHSVQVVELSRT